MQRNKVVIIGTTHTGKTSIIQRYVNDQFSETTATSTQAAYFQKEITFNGKKHTLELWDTAGQEKYRALAPIYYRDATAGIVVYDITDASSFSKAKQWINELKNVRGDQVFIALVGNKCDLSAIRVVQTIEAKQYAKLNGFLYIETSAKTGININELFNDLSNLILSHAAEITSIVEDQVAEPLHEEKSGGCC